MWYEKIIEFFERGTIANYILDAYLVLIIVSFVVSIATKNKRFLSIIIPMLIVLVGCFAANKLDLGISKTIYNYVCILMPIALVVIFAPDIRAHLDNLVLNKETNKVQAATDDNKQEIADAAMYLSNHKIGALITIEKHKLLDQYAKKAIVINSDISKELLINIFTPNTPLHDGAVIIKGNKIRCAGAYYVLSTRELQDKTVGSRHRAALGISEVTDSITIVVSEETGKISVTYSGIIVPVNGKDKLLEYIDLAME